MKTECTPNKYRFPSLNRREVEGTFDGGTITSDAGGLLLGKIEEKFGIIRRLAGCFTDYRDPDATEHSVGELLAQRIYGICLGYEDLNDHDDLRLDPLLATLVGKADPTGQDRVREQDRGKPLAGKSTLNRLELSAPEADEKDRRYKKIVADPEKIDRLFVDLFLQMSQEVPSRIVLDLDATDDPIHGQQEGRFFHGYYKEYCYLPLYIFCGNSLLCARLRQANGDACEGTVEELEWIVPQIRRVWPDVEIVIRADSGFCREKIMHWCEQNRVHYILGLAQNPRLKKEIRDEMEQAKELYEQTGEAARVFKDFSYRTRESWSRSRRVIAKAEHLEKGANPRFVVTSYSAEEWESRTLYEEEYCARGEMENRIKEQQQNLFADRTSTAVMRANQLRLWFSSFAYVFMNALRNFGLAGTEMEKAQCHTIRNKILKIGAQVRVTVRRVWVSMATGYPYEHLFEAVHRNLDRLEPLRC
jgi:hypothetical protein